ncbi:helix-turn-helix transcriptional regulator [Streptomyces griseoluteus]|uniref:helix-turn-helix domain-containing protein n=1 Tax=Streptomyces griseoluteus TaxID=29306 RepID=UPI003425975C
MLPTPPPDDDEIASRRVAFGDRVRTARQAAGLTQDQLAEQAGLDRVQISEIERGRRDARLSTLLRIESALGTQLIWA